MPFTPFVRLVVLTVTLVAVSCAGPGRTDEWGGGDPAGPRTAPRAQAGAPAGSEPLGPAPAPAGGRSSDGDGGGEPSLVDECGRGAVRASAGPTVEPAVRRGAEEFRRRCDAVSFVIDIDAPGHRRLADAVADVCGNRYDLVVAAAGPGDLDEVSCDRPGAEVVALALVREAVVLATATDGDGPDCLDGADVGALVLAGPPRHSILAALLAELVTGPVGLRPDYRGTADVDAVIERLVVIEGGIAALDLGSALADPRLIRTIALAADGGRCVAPSERSIAEGRYPGSRTVYLIARHPGSGSEPIGPFVDFLVGAGYEQALLAGRHRDGLLPLEPEELAASVDRWRLATDR